MIDRTASQVPSGDEVSVLRRKKGPLVAMAVTVSALPALPYRGGPGLLASAAESSGWFGAGPLAIYSTVALTVLVLMATGYRSRVTCGGGELTVTTLLQTRTAALTDVRVAVTLLQRVGRTRVPLVVLLDDQGRSLMRLSASASWAEGQSTRSIEEVLRRHGIPLRPTGRVLSARAVSREFPWSPSVRRLHRL